MYDHRDLHYGPEKSRAAVRFEAKTRRAQRRERALAKNSERSDAAGDGRATYGGDAA